MKFRQLLAAPLLLALLVTGCTNSEETGESNTTPLPAVDVNAHERTELQPGGEIRLAVTRLGASNPMVDGASPEMTDVQRAFLPSFFNYDRRGVPRPNTAFLESFTVTSTNPTMVTLKLNPQAVWGDGAKITGNDLIATWKACNGQSVGFRCAPDLEFDQIADVRLGNNESEVRLVFDKAYPQWTAIFDRVSVLREASVADGTTFNTWQGYPKEWTAGPFVADAQQAAGSLLLSPNQTWWGEDPLLQRITVKEIAEDEQMEAYKNSLIDAVDIGTSPETFLEAQTVPEFSLRRIGSPTWRQLAFNTQSSGPVNEMPVRQAIGLTVDRSALGTAAYPDIAFTASALGNRIFLQGQEGYVDNAQELDLIRDLGAARELLDQAGWQESDGTRTRDGRTLEVSLVQVDEDPVSQAEVATLTNQLAQVGIKVNVEQVSLADFENGSVLARGNFDLVVTEIEGSRHPYVDLADRFGSGADENYARFESPEIDQLLEDIANEPEPPQREALANQLDVTLWQAMPTLPLFQVPETMATRTRISNFGALGLATPDWVSVGYITTD